MDAASAASAANAANLNNAAKVAAARGILINMIDGVQASFDFLSAELGRCTDERSLRSAGPAIESAKRLIEINFNLREGALTLFEIISRSQPAHSAASLALAHAHYMAAVNAYKAAVTNHAAARPDEELAAYKLVVRTRRKMANADNERERAIAAWYRNG